MSEGFTDEVTLLVDRMRELKGFNWDLIHPNYDYNNLKEDKKNPYSQYNLRLNECKSKRKLIALKNQVHTQNFDLLIADEDRPVIDLIIKSHGVIFNGYIRDRIAKDKPNNIDVLIPQSSREDFHKAMEILKYTWFKTQSKHIADNYLDDEDARMDNVFLYEKPKTLDVKVLFVNHDIESRVKVLAPHKFSDYDVNALTYDGKSLYVYFNKDIDVTPIIENIQKKKAVQYMSMENFYRDRSLWEACENQGSQGLKTFLANLNPKATIELAASLKIAELGYDIILPTEEQKKLWKSENEN
jgi:hypothetical protein